MNVDLNQNKYIKGQIIPINKERGWSSFAVVKKLKYIIRKKYNLDKLKVGHAGTLDPLATGVLIICTGKATKQIIRLQDSYKEYLAEMRLGATTPSFDAETQIDELYPVDHITKAKIIEVLKKFEGDIEQIPPAYSALKINGIRAYKLARKGEHVEIKSRHVYIKNIKIIDYEKDICKFLVSCTKGTYIRSLIKDIGKELKTGAYMTDLVRISSGDYSLNDTMTISQFEKSC